MWKNRNELYEFDLHAENCNYLYHKDSSASWQHCFQSSNVINVYCMPTARRIITNSIDAMSSTNCLHFIKILNLQQNEIIPHQFLLIKGRVDQPTCWQPTTITLNCISLQILNTGISKETGIFKFILNLGTSSNKLHLKFQYCNAIHELNLSYEPKVSHYKIQPLLILAQDESADENVQLFKQIIDLNLLLIQSVYAEKLREHCDERLCFVFNDNCVIFNSHLTKEKIYQLTEHELWSNFAKELLESEWGAQSQLKFVAFISCSKYLGDEVVKTGDFSYNNIRQHIRGHAACGTGGLALFSSTYFYSWPRKFNDILNCFSNNHGLDLSTQPDDSNYRRTYAGVYASSLGAVCHEIGHIFDLGHDLEGVMGSNFDYINHVFSLPTTKTEHLPERIISSQAIQSADKPRYTQLRKTQARNFLDCYRKQKENDSFYFSPNSAIILSHHPWIKPQQVGSIENKVFEIIVDKHELLLKSTCLPLKIIEIRKESNSLVTEWIEFQKCTKDPQVFLYDLSRFKNKLLNDSYYVFVMSCDGQSKKISI